MSTDEPDGDIRPALGAALAARSGPRPDQRSRGHVGYVVAVFEPGSDEAEDTLSSTVLHFDEADAGWEADLRAGDNGSSTYAVCEVVRIDEDGDTATALIAEVLHLRQNGERAPGGNETWAEWERKAEQFLRGLLDGERT